MQHSPYYPASAHIKKSFSIDSFDKFFLKSKDNFTQLSRLIKQCNIDNIHCRFNVWRLCLGVVSVQSTQQQKHHQMEQSRKKYQQKKQQALKSFSKKSPIKQPVKKNPLLMMGPIKPQQNKEIETDEFLKQQIHKDVERTYQEMKFFLDKAIAKLLNLILFIWCRLNPDVSYKQGMNQLLASAVVCYFKQAEFKGKQDKPEDMDEKLWESHLFFNSVEHSESDIFSVFQKIIDIQGEMYKTQADLTIKSKVNPNSKNNTPILQRIMQIKDHKLKHMDLQLFRILKLQDVQTKSFMLRWIRCMHTREFDLENSFVIWDSIFLQYEESQNSRKNRQFEFIDAMCLAMFMYMRSIVFTKQTAGEILQVYQKYPALKRGVYLDELITLAWTICEQMRLQSQNIQTAQTNSNWFQQSSKIKALHFMQKKPQKKPAQQPQVKPTPPPTKKQEPRVQKQLKQTDHKKHPQIAKKHTQPTHHSTTAKHKETTHSEGSNNHHSQILKPKKQKTKNQQKSDQIIHQPSNHKKSQDNSLHHKSSPMIEKQMQSDLIKTKNIQQRTKQTIIEHKQAKQEKHQKTVKQKQNSLPSPFHHRQESGSKIPQHLSISLSQYEIEQILQNLNESVCKIRDIDAQSLIRRTIKKIQGKVKIAKQYNGKQQSSSHQATHKEP